MALTFALTIFWDLEMGIAVSLVISLVLVVHKSSKPRMTILVSTCLVRAQSLTRLTECQGRLPGTDVWKPVDENPEAQEDTAGVLIVRIRENLDFGAYFDGCY